MQLITVRSKLDISADFWFHNGGHTEVVLQNLHEQCPTVETRKAFLENGFYKSFNVA